MKKSLIAIAFLTALSTAQAADLDSTIAAGLSDCFTTAAGLMEAGAVEANPVGPVAACALKIPFLMYANSRPEPHRTQMLQIQSASWTAAAVNNVFITLGTPVAFAPAAIMLYGLWQEGAPEREFYEICAALQKNTPAIQCTYKKPVKQYADSGAP
jgi:hypothetical protein